jgi:carboxyl-terminal processing protease
VTEVMKKKLIIILSYVAVAAAAAALTLCLTFRPNHYTKLEELADLLEQRFIDGVDRTEMENAAADAMVEALGDRWSYYIPASNYGDYQAQKNNAYVGIGVTISAAEEGYLIEQVSKGGPAEKAGLLAGDVIVAVDDTRVAGMSTEEGKELVQGKSGTTVKITVQRAGEEKTFSVKRGTVKTPVATGVLLPDNIGLVTIKNFNANCAKETIAAIESLVEQGATALIFDVRFNGGGYANEMNKVLDYLLPAGQLFKTLDYTGKEEVTKSDAKCLEMPMAVLVNGSSYSAAEFFAAALREYDWATVAGEQTSGKGYYQVVYTLSDGSAVGVSIGKYFTPKGVSLEGVGITPDHVVQVDQKTAAAIRAGTLDPMEDPQVLAAIAALKGQ